MFNTPYLAVSHQTTRTLLNASDTTTALQSQTQQSHAEYLSHQTLLFTMKQHLRTDRLTSLRTGCWSSLVGSFFTLYLFRWYKCSNCECVDGNSIWCVRRRRREGNIWKGVSSNWWPVSLYVGPYLLIKLPLTCSTTWPLQEVIKCRWGQSGEVCELELGAVGTL